MEPSVSPLTTVCVVGSATDGVVVVSTAGGGISMVAAGVGASTTVTVDGLRGGLYAVSVGCRGHGLGIHDGLLSHVCGGGDQLDGRGGCSLLSTGDDRHQEECCCTAADERGGARRESDALVHSAWTWASRTTLSERRRLASARVLRISVRSRATSGAAALQHLGSGCGGRSRRAHSRLWRTAAPLAWAASRRWRASCHCPRAARTLPSRRAASESMGSRVSSIRRRSVAGADFLPSRGSGLRRRGWPVHRSRSYRAGGRSVRWRRDHRSRGEPRQGKDRQVGHGILGEEEGEHVRERTQRSDPSSRGVWYYY